MVALHPPLLCLSIVVRMDHLYQNSSWGGRSVLCLGLRLHEEVTCVPLPTHRTPKSQQILSLVSWETLLPCQLSDQCLR